ncbi:MAG: sensor domain-containing diguanylate cyclase [Candidatus Thiodiazotropha sp. (ex Monitilora ramsayi)]|nr:sensor domain-containing diguanylate cyclase [Candidatus Thiodiazotropha sp. (ex Monitilora ramsayi)]
MDLEQENRRLFRQLRDLRKEAQRSQTTLERFHTRELELMSADTLAELLHVMTEGMLVSFRVDSIQVLLDDPDHEIRLLLNNSGYPDSAFAFLRFVDDIFSINPRFSRLNSPWLGPFLTPDFDNLFDDTAGLRSMAILPVFCRNRLVGSINLGSRDASRFSRDLATDFLARLGKICGVCLENTINRERLLISGLTDPLTELHNRRYLDRRLDEELARASRYNQPMSCLFIDADHFKQINDNHGHQAGDTALRELANRIRSQLRASDVATRYGGEEFALLLPQTGLNEAMLLAERIRLEVASNPIQLNDGNQLDLTVSIGVSETLPMLGKSRHKEVGEHLLASADQALYQAKARGRNRIESLDQNRSEPATRQIKIGD